MENYCWKKNYMYALVAIYKTILHYHWWSSLYLVNKNMDGWVEINIKLDTFLDSICYLQHTWKEGYGNDCLCFVFNCFYFFLLLFPPHKKRSWPSHNLFLKKYWPYQNYLLNKSTSSRPSLYRSIPSDKYCTVSNKEATESRVPSGQVEVIT